MATFIRSQTSQQTTTTPSHATSNVKLVLPPIEPSNKQRSLQERDLTRPSKWSRVNVSNVRVPKSMYHPLHSLEGGARAYLTRSPAEGSRRHRLPHNPHLNRKVPVSSISRVKPKLTGKVI